MFANAAQAYSRMVGLLGFCFMTTTKACQGTGVSGWERARVWDGFGNGIRNGLGLVLYLGKGFSPSPNLTFSRIRDRVRVTLT